MACALFIACASEGVLLSKQPAGVFYTLSSCADCSGVHTYILLKKDSFVRARQHLKHAHKTNLFIDSGTVLWNEERKMLHLENKKDNQYLLSYHCPSDTAFFRLDIEGNVIEGALAEDFTYRRVPGSWKELLEKIIQEDILFRRSHHPKP